MTEPRTCPRCGRETPDDAPRGLCPACLLGAALVGPGDASDQNPGLDADEPSMVGHTAADTRYLEGRPGTIGGETVELSSRESNAEAPPGPASTIRYFGDYEVQAEL